VTLAAVVITAFVLAGGILLSALPVSADEASDWEMRQGYPTPPARVMTAPAAAPLELDIKDEIAALERIQFALSEVGDGTTYVWRRWHGRLAGVIHPTSSFKDASGKVCRHLLVLLTTGMRTSKMEGVACRLPSGRWQLDG
jgi:hypothetical protein